MAQLELALEQAELLVEQLLEEHLLEEQPLVEQQLAEQPLVERPWAEQLWAEQRLAEQRLVEQLAVEQLVVELAAEEGPCPVALVPLATKWSLEPRMAVVTAVLAAEVESQAGWLPGPHHRHSTMQLT